MIHLNFIGLLGGNDNTDPLGLLFNVLFFGFFLIMMFYGQKIQGWQASKQIETALDKLKNWNDDCKEILFNQYSKYSNEKDSDKDVKIKLEELMQQKGQQSRASTPRLIDRLDLLESFELDDFITPDS